MASLTVFSLLLTSNLHLLSLLEIFCNVITKTEYKFSQKKDFLFIQGNWRTSFFSSAFFRFSGLQSLILIRYQGKKFRLAILEYDTERMSQLRHSIRTFTTTSRSFHISFDLSHFSTSTSTIHYILGKSPDHVWSFTSLVSRTIPLQSYTLLRHLSLFLVSNFVISSKRLFWKMWFVQDKLATHRIHFFSAFKE